MRAYAIDRFGEPGTVRELPDPTPGDGEVVIRVHAASVNPMDAFVISGAAQSWKEHRLPLVPGLDAAGVVEQVGPGVTRLHRGDEVIANVSDLPFYGAGTFAERVAAPAGSVALKPARLSFDEASTLPLAGLTALAAVEALEPLKDKVVVVIGATGAVGSFFVQLAAKRGASVVALARPANADYARGLGAAEVVDHTADAVATIRASRPAGIDTIADFTGNQTLLGGVSTLLKAGGVIASTGARQLDAEAYAARGLTVVAANRLPLDRLADITRAVEVDGIRPPHIERHPLADAAAAVARVGQRHNRGKVVLTID
jgi:NADPH:quinone reductase-like Zn-dependent oxidoreductase